MEAYETEKAAMGENMEKEQWMKESLQMQKASWIQDEITKRREREDELLQQIFMEQKMLQELDEDMDENMAHAREGRKYREDMKERVNDRVYEIHDLSADKREGMREYKYAYRRGYALAMFFFSLALCVFVGFLHGITSQICLMLMFFTGVQAAIFVHQKQCFFLWRLICDIFSAVVFPVMKLWGAVCAVFGSWMNDRAILYRKLNNIPAEWGTAVTVQAMVFGNMGSNSATGVAFSRDAATGENLFNGEYLINAQGEDVVAGIRTPQQITLEGSKRWAAAQNISEEDRRTKYPSLEEVMPVVYKELDEIQHHLEQYFKDMQDIEFTIQDGKLWMLQCRNGKRTGAAMVKIAMDMLREGLIDERTAVLRCEPAKLDELLHPVFDKKAITNAQVITKGLPASPGAATGPVVFFAEDAEKTLAQTGQKAILVRIETSPEDLKGMLDAAGILTARGGMTSHAAVVARGMGKCCVSGAGELEIDYKTRTIKVNGFTVKEGDWISLNGSTGEVYLGQVATMAADLSGDFGQLMDLAGKYAVLKVRANADTPKDAAQAFGFGAEGIGLCRTEHMFFEGDRIKAFREMILADDEAGRRVALAKLLPIQRSDFEGLFKAMNGFPVTVRLLDPPLHEFVPHDEKGQKEMAREMDVPLQKIVAKVESLAEFNPMLGHRGCRLGNTYPEITEMQARAIIEAAMNVRAQGTPVHVEIMVPLVGNHKELRYQKGIIDSTAEQVFSERNDKIDYMVGTMIEVPRAAVTAHQIAEVAEFFSFGTNDLTQMTLGFSRDDIGKFLPIYLDKGILKNDPFQILDQNGVGQLIREAVFKGRGKRPMLKCGICGEHGGEPSSVEFCHYAGLNYVSCSPFRVPIARLAAAHAALKEK